MNASSLLTRSTSSICRACRRNLIRQFSSTARASVASYQSYTLPSQVPPQPRNATAADTSITHAIETPLPRVHETRPPQPASKPTSSTATISLPEQQAQRSSPSLANPPPTTQPNTTTTAAEPTTTPRPRSKLRTPRKAAVKLTPAAVSHLRRLLDGPSPKLIKVGVRNRGCSGLAYHLSYVERAGAFDEAVEQDGVTVLVDSKALFSIIGSEMDWVEDKLSQRFVFRNPNIKEECGCGESFMV